MLAPAILGSLNIPASAAPAVAALTNTLGGQTVEALLESVLPGGVTLRLPDGRLLQAQGNLPFSPGSLLTLKAMTLPEGAGLRLQVVRATPPPTPALLSPLVQGEALALLARLQAPSANPSPLTALLRTLLQAGGKTAEQPETWSTWMKEAMQGLADAVLSPAEAPFHRLQAKEGTGWFELPLPWAAGAEPLRIWIEGDQEQTGSESEQVRRVFLSVPFTELGDVRLGLELRASGLRARLWLQNPAQLASLRPTLQAELATLGKPVELQLLPLPSTALDLRALAGASPLQAMG